MFVHVFDLAFHRKKEKNNEVDKKDWPEDGNIKDTEESHAEANQDSF